MALEPGLCKVVQGSFNQGNAIFGKTAGIQFVHVWHYLQFHIQPYRKLTDGTSLTLILF